jgi:hypothetical protein
MLKFNFFLNLYYFLPQKPLTPPKMKSVVEGERRKLHAVRKLRTRGQPITEGERGEERKTNICIWHNVKPSCILLEYTKSYRKSQFKKKLQII